MADWWDENDPDAESPGVNEMIDRDRGSWEQRLREEAAAKGLDFNQSDLEGVIRQVSYASNVGKDPGEFLNQAIARYGERATNTPGGDQGGGGGGGGGANFGGTPAPFGETYSTLGRPSWLEGPYTPPTWNETFTPQTMEQVQSEPGYALGLREGQNTIERSAAARGSILSGGTQKALARFGTDYGGTKYAESNDRAFDAYRQRYGQFLDTNQMGANARNMNEGAYQVDVGNNANQYGTRYRSYLDSILNRRNAETDLWGRQMDVARNGLTAAGLARP